jgi:MFS family permease
VPTSEPNIPLWRRILGQKATGNSLIYEPLPLSDLDQGIVGWDSQDDAEMPFNFPTRQKWIWVWLLCAMTLLTPLASSILSPGIQQFSEEFGNTNDIVGSMTVSIYLLGYVVGPIFIAPLSEIYGRKPVLTVSNIFFSIWQIGCALAPNVEGLVVSRFFSGLGGAACLVSRQLLLLAQSHLITAYRLWGAV